MTISGTNPLRSGRDQRSKKEKSDGVGEISREDQFITKLQARLEADLDGCGSLDFKERNALYANAIKFLAVLTKFSGGDDDGSWWGKD
jgi:hypothetical protein